MSEDLNRGYSSGENTGGYVPPPQTSPENQRLRNEVEELRRQVKAMEEADALRREKERLEKRERDALMREKNELEERIRKRNGK